MNKEQEITAKIEELFREALNRETVDRDASFLSQGGTSLGYMKLQQAIKENFGLKVTMRELYKWESINGIGTKLAAKAAASGAPAKEGNKDAPTPAIHPLTDIEKAILRGRSPLLPLGGCASSTCFTLRIRPFEEERFRRAVDSLLARHPALRIRYMENETCRLETNGSADICLSDLRDLGREQQDYWVSRQTELQRKRQYSPDREDLLSATVLLLTEEEALAVFSFDGLGSDGAGMQILIEDLIHLYEGTEPSAIPAADDYFSYREKIMAATPKVPEDLAYWQEILETFENDPGLPVLTRPERITRAESKQLAKAIDSAAWESFSAQSRKIGVTPFAAALALFGKVLSRYGEQHRFLINVPVSGDPARKEARPVGPFMDFYYVGIDDTNAVSLSMLATECQEHLLDAAEHATVSGPALASLAAERGDNSPSVPVTFSSLLDMGYCLQGNSVQTEQIRTHTSQTILEALLVPLDGEIRILLNYESHLIEKRIAAGILDTFAENLVLAAGTAQDWGAFSELELCESDKAVIHPVCFYEKGGEEDYQSLPASLAAALNEEGDRIALAGEFGEITYEKLRDAIIAYSGMMTSACNGTPVRVGILMEKDPMQVVAALCCLIHGSIYAPLEPELPEETLLVCVENEDLDLLVTTPEIAGQLECKLKVPCLTVSLEELLAASDSHGAPLLAAETAPDKTIIFINTSGTTGVPKSVEITHRALAHCLKHTPVCFGIETHPRIIGVTNFCHDLAVYDTLASILMRGTLVLPSAQKRKEPRHWAELMERYRVTFWNSVPAFMDMLMMLDEETLKKSTRTLRTVVLGGDRVTPELIRRIESNCTAHCISIGGPTETTIWNIYHRIEPGDSAEDYIPYGGPFPYTGYHILNELLQICPVGVPGLMYVSGVSLANGYYRAEDKTREKFIGWNGERLYNTCDLGYYRPDGEIRIIGRGDLQVKINGKRIELAGIEDVMQRYPGIERASVMVTGNKRLCAVYTATGDIDETSLLATMAASLPDYMLPRQLLRIEEIPKTRNGKPDRVAMLALIESGAEEEPREKTAEEDYEMPAPVSAAPSTTDVHLVPDASPADDVANGMADFLLQACRDVIDDEIEPTDDFFDMGGDSLAAMKLSALIQEEYGVVLQVFDIMGSPTIEEWVVLIEQAS